MSNLTSFITEGVDAVYTKLKWWFVITSLVFITYTVIFIGNLLSPGVDEKQCIASLNNGISTFTYDIKSAAQNRHGIQITNPYDDGGQNIDWVYTGFKTTGDKLVISVDGTYFPYGKDLTMKRTVLNYIVKQNSDGQMNILNPEEQYYQCPLNTDLTLDAINNSNLILTNSQHLSRYTSDNLQNTSEILSNIGQSDCIKGFNCDPSTSNNMTQTACALSNGAGIYMGFGNEPAFAYHLYNPVIPILVSNCTVDQSASCQYSYLLDSNRNIVYRSVPMTLPTYTYSPIVSMNLVQDIRNVLPNTSLVPAIKSTLSTKYQYTTYQPVDIGNCSGTNNADYEIISGKCYQSVSIILSNNNINPVCPVDYSKENGLNHPNELCPPPPNQKIFVKAFNTVYDTADGSVDISFLSGAKPEQPIVKSDGVLGFLSNVLHVVISPLWGSQVEDNVQDYTKVVYNIDSIDIYAISDVAKMRSLYYTQSKGDIAIKLDKNANQALIFSLPIYPNASYSYFVSNYDNGDKNHIQIKLRADVQLPVSVKDLQLTYTANADRDFIKINHMSDGFFVQARNKILESYIFQLARVLMVVWYIFAFGFGVVYQKATISMEKIKDDWFRFAVLIWATDTKNYQLIDDFIIPLFFRGFLNISTLFTQAANNIMGTSMQIDNALDFFDNIVSMIFSKTVFTKLYAISMSEYFWIHFLIFPLLASGIAKMIYAFLKYIVSLILVVVNIGSMISLFPIFCLLSMLDKFQSLMQSWFTKMKNEFVNLAISIGFFGLFSGFIFSYFLKAVSYNMCWKHIFDMTIIPFVWTLSFGHWIITDNISLTSIILQSGLFYIMASTFSAAPAVAQQLATQLFGGDGGLGFNMKNAGNIFDSIESKGGDFWNTVKEKVSSKDNTTKKSSPEEMRRKKLADKRLARQNQQKKNEMLNKKQNNQQAVNNNLVQRNSIATRPNDWRNAQEQARVVLPNTNNPYNNPTAQQQRPVFSPNTIPTDTYNNSTTQNLSSALAARQNNQVNDTSSLPVISRDVNSVPLMQQKIVVNPTTSNTQPVAQQQEDRNNTSIPQQTGVVLNPVASQTFNIPQRPIFSDRIQINPGNNITAQNLSSALAVRQNNQVNDARNINRDGVIQPQISNLAPSGRIEVVTGGVSGVDANVQLVGNVGFVAPGGEQIENANPVNNENNAKVEYQQTQEKQERYEDITRMIQEVKNNRNNNDWENE